VSAFDAVAGAFERERALPAEVPEAIRRVVRDRGRHDPALPLLEIGCGTGRIGSAFCTAGELFWGVDFSAEMLREFQARAFTRPPLLVQADASALPFAGGRFGAVLMMHVLTASNWRSLLVEARRVLHGGGVLVIGKAEAPADGIDAAMRRRLDAVLADLGKPEPPPKRRAIADWLDAHSAGHEDVVAASWSQMRRPRDFFRRKASAARFGQLPAPVKDAALQSLSTWAEESLGPLDQPQPEQHRFRLQLYWF